MDLDDLDKKCIRELLFYSTLTKYRECLNKTITKYSLEIMEDYWMYSLKKLNLKKINEYFSFTQEDYEKGVFSKLLRFDNEYNDLYSVIVYHKVYPKFKKYMKKYLKAPTCKIVDGYLIAQKDFVVLVNEKDSIDNRPFFLVIKKGEKGGKISNKTKVNLYNHFWLNPFTEIRGKSDLDFSGCIQNSIIEDSSIKGDSYINQSCFRKSFIENSKIETSIFIRNNICSNSCIKMSIIYDEAEIFNSSFMTDSIVRNSIWIDNSEIIESILDNFEKIKGKTIYKDTKNLDVKEYTPYFSILYDNEYNKFFDYKERGNLK